MINNESSIQKIEGQTERFRANGDIELASALQDIIQLLGKLPNIGDIDNSFVLCLCSLAESAYPHQYSISREVILNFRELLSLAVNTLEIQEELNNSEIERKAEELMQIVEKVKSLLLCIQCKDKNGVVMIGGNPFCVDCANKLQGLFECKKELLIKILELNFEEMKTKKNLIISYSIALEAIEKGYTLPQQIYGDNIMGDKYEGQVGAVGAGARADHNIFFQKVQKEVDEISLSNRDIEQLQKLIERLTTSVPKEIPNSVVSQAASYLWALIEAAESKDKDGQVLAVSQWRQWWSDIGEKTRETLSLVADIASLGLPLAKLFGLPVP